MECIHFNYYKNKQTNLEKCAVNRIGILDQFFFKYEAESGCCFLDMNLFRALRQQRPMFLSTAFL